MIVARFPVNVYSRDLRMSPEVAILPMYPALAWPVQCGHMDFQQ